MAELTALARPYAKAAFLFAREQNALEKWASMLGLTAALVEDPQMERVLGSPSLSDEARVKAIATVCGDALDQSGVNFITQLAENGRLKLLPTIFEQFHRLRSQEQGVADVEVISAYELDEAEVERLKASLNKRLGKDIRINSKVDAGLIGGVVIRAGDTVIDGSVRGRLQKLAEQLNTRI